VLALELVGPHTPSQYFAQSCQFPHSGLVSVYCYGADFLSDESVCRRVSGCVGDKQQNSTLCLDPTAGTVQTGEQVVVVAVAVCEQHAAFSSVVEHC